ncbi:MAG: ABC transporter substrate-binding protein [Thermodesulfobacteriota bacterium]
MMNTTTINGPATKKRRAFFLLPALLSAALLVGACLDSKPIKIGFAGQLTGSGSDLGVYGRNGAMLAVEEINESGGINGRKIKLIVKDDLGTSKGAIKADRELQQENVAAVIGHMTSSQSRAALDFINAQKLILLSPTTSTPLLSGKDDYFFRISQGTDSAAKSMAHFLVEKKSRKKAITIGSQQNDAYVNPYIVFFSARFSRLGGIIEAKKNFPANQKQWKNLIETIHEHPQSMLVCVLNSRQLTKLLQKINLSGIENQVISTGWAMTNELLNAAGKTANGVWFVANTFGDTAERNEFETNYKKRFGDFPNFAAIRAYDAVRVLRTAIKRSQDENIPLKKALVKTENFPGLYGKISLNRFGDVKGRNAVFKSKNGTFKEITVLNTPDLRLN